MGETFVCEMAKKVISHRTLEYLITLGCKYPEFLRAELEALDDITGYVRKECEYTIPHLISTFRQHYLND